MIKEETGAIEFHTITDGKVEFVEVDYVFPNGKKERMALIHSDLCRDAKTAKEFAELFEKIIERNASH